MAKHEELSPQYVRELYDASEKHWGTWRHQAQRDSDYFDENVPRGEFDLRLQPNSRYIEVRPSTYRDKCLNAITRLLANPMQITVEKPGSVGHDRPSEKAERQADYAEALTNALLYHAEHQHGNIHLVRESGLKAIVTGMGALALWYDESEAPRPPRRRRTEQAMAEWRARRRSHFPLRIQCLDPLTVWPSPDDGRSWVIRVIKRYGFDLRQTYGWAPPAPSKGWEYELFDFAIYCDATRYWYGTFEGDGQRLNEFEHFWGHIPVVLWPSGFGEESNEPHRKYRGLCTNARLAKYFVEEARILSQIDAINADFAWPAILAHATLGSPNFGPGQVSTVDTPNVDDVQKGINVLRGITVPQGLYDELRVVREKINDSTISEIIGSGDVPASDPTSKTIRRLNEAAERLSWLRANTERGWERVFEVILGALKGPYFDDEDAFDLRGIRDMVAFSIKLARDKIPDNPMVRVHIDPVSPQERFARLQAGLAMRTAINPLTGMPEIDRKTFLEEYVGFGDGGAKVEERLEREHALAVLRQQTDHSYLIGRAVGQIPETVSLGEFVGSVVPNAQAQSEQTAQQAAVGGPERIVPGALGAGSPLDELGGSAVPLGRRGFQGNRAAVAR